MCARPANVDGTGKDSYERTGDESSNAVQGRGGHGIVYGIEPFRARCSCCLAGNSLGKRFAAREATERIPSRVCSSTARRTPPGYVSQEAQEDDGRLSRLTVSRDRRCAYQGYVDSPWGGLRFLNQPSKFRGRACVRCPI